MPITITVNDWTTIDYDVVDVKMSYYYYASAYYCYDWYAVWSWK